MAVSRLFRRVPVLSNFYHNRPILPTPSGMRTCFSASESSEEESFEEMFRNCRFVKMGRPQGKTVVGKILHIVDHEVSRDLYIDFGWKFHAVCTQSKDERYKV